MESLKTLVNALRVLFDGVDSKLADVRNGLARVWEWINGLAWVARSETIERLPETTVHFEGTSYIGNEYTLDAALPLIDISGLKTGDTVIVWKDGIPLRCGIFAEQFMGVYDWLICYPATMEPLNALFQSEFFICKSGASCAMTMKFPDGEVDEYHTFAIKPETMPEVKLESAFVDARWSAGGGAARVEGWMTCDGYRLKQNYHIILKLGQAYTLVVAGTPYSDVAKALEDGTVYIGNPHISDESQEDNGLAFYIESGDSGIYVTGLTTGQEYFTGVYEGIVEPLPNRYAPAGVYEKIAAAAETVASGAMTKSNPTGSGYFSLNRKAGATAGQNSVAEGYSCDASGFCSHAEGWCTTASSEGSHAEGRSTEASGNHAHAEGHSTIASGEGSHAEGYESKASYYYTHAEGRSTEASGHCAHAEGQETAASGSSAHAEGSNTIAASTSQHVQGRYNIADSAGKYAHIVGNGDIRTRSNAHTLDWRGNGWFAGDVYVGSTSGSDMDEGSVKLLKEGGDGSNLTASYSVPDVRESLTSGEKLSTALGKIAKWLGALDEDVARYKNGQLATIAGVVIPTGGGGGGGGDVVVDIALNADSTNPVQNAAIYAALDGKAPKDHDHSAADIKTGTLPISRGGTGASTAADARANLDVYSKAEVAAAITSAIGDAIAASY